MNIDKLLCFISRYLHNLNSLFKHMFTSELEKYVNDQVELSRLFAEYIHLYNLLFEWMKVRPFLRIGQSSYARELVLDMIFVIKSRLVLYDNLDDHKRIKKLYRLLNSYPPGHCPPNRPCKAKQGLFFYTKFLGRYCSASSMCPSPTSSTSSMSAIVLASLITR